MSGELVERLRAGSHGRSVGVMCCYDCVDERRAAADRIEQLEGERDALRTVLAEYEWTVAASRFLLTRQKSPRDAGAALVALADRIEEEGNDG